MVVTLIRTLIIFTTLVVVMRLMGKRQIGEMQPFEFIVTLIIADLACIPMADISIPLIYGIVSILGLFLLHQLLSLLEQSGNFFKTVISGKPSIVINKSGADMQELKKNNMDVEDLIESMRSQGYFSLDDLDYAIFESNGKLSAFASRDAHKKSSSLPILIVDNGKENAKNLQIANIEKSELLTFLKRENHNLKTTEIMTMDGEGRVYLKCKKTPYEILFYNLKEGVKW